MEKIIASMILNSMLAGVFTGCAVEDEIVNNGNNVVTQNTNLLVQTLSVESKIEYDSQFSNKDYSTDVNYDNVVNINLSDNASTSDDSSVVISGNIITISKDGSYILSGNLSDGQICIDAEDTVKIQLILNGVNINNNTSASINVVKADKVFITTAKDTENIISATIVDDANSSVDSAIHSKEDLTLNGLGSLTVKSVNGNGILSKDDLVFTSGDYSIIADSHGLEANNSVRIAGGTFDITSGKDGIHCADEDISKGYIYIQDGTISIDAQGDGLDSTSQIEILDGEFNITTAGGSENVVFNSNVQMGQIPGNMQGQQGQMGQIEQEQETTENTVSTKGIKADVSIIISNGNFVIDTFDDALHSNTSLLISGGNFNIKTGDDAINSSYITAITGNPVINIETCYEGIEGQQVDISGGTIDIYSNDDGINAVLNDVGVEDSEVYINISGGKINMDTNLEGDGFDSNGNIYMSGGDVYIKSTTVTTDTALDYEKIGYITGGTFVSVGSNSRTAQNFGEQSTQGSIWVSLSATQSDDVKLTDSNGNVLVEYSPNKIYQAITISTPDIKIGETYILTAGTYTQEIKMDTLIYGQGNETSNNIGGQGNRR